MKRVVHFSELKTSAIRQIQVEAPYLKKLEFSLGLFIRKILYALIFLFVCSFSLSISVAQAASKCESFYSSSTQVKEFEKVLPASLVREKLYAVHATNFFPNNGVIIADGRDLSIPILRSEIHFSLGGLVPAHISGNWEKHKYAVVTPLLELEPQLANLMVFDTIIYGDFKIPKSAILVIPEDASINSLPEGINVHRYSSNITLREAIEKVIESNSGWIVKANYGDGRSNDKAIIQNGTNINSPIALKEILDLHPNVSFLNGVQTKGDIISHWSRFLLKYFTMKERLYISTPQLKFEKKKLELFAANIRNDVQALNLTGISKNGYLRFKSKVKYLNYFLDLEIELREKYGRSIFSSDPKVWIPKILPLIQTQKKLRELVFSKIDSFEPPSESYNGLFATNIAEDLVTLSKKNIITLLKETPDFLNKVEGGAESVFDYFAVKRLAALGQKNADQEGLLSDIESAFEHAAKTNYGVAQLLTV